jgi:hypothetical protein
VEQGTAVTSAAARVLQVVRAGYGAALLLLPGPVIRLCTGRPAGHRTRNVARVLGARHLVQAAVTAGSGPSAESLGIGAAIDITHAASMAGLAAADRCEACHTDRCDHRDRLCRGQPVICPSAATGMSFLNA